MKIKLHIHKKAWFIIVVTLFVILGMNTILQIERFIPIIGDSKDWLGWSIAIIAVILGCILNHNYSIKRSEEENRIRLHAAKIQEEKTEYSKLEEIILENIQILDFDNIKSRIERISPTNSNTFLLSELSNYQKELNHINTKLDIFFKNKYEEREEKEYKEIIHTIASTYKTVSNFFISYLSSLEDNITTGMANIEDIIPVATKYHEINLRVKKISGRNQITDKKKEFRDIINEKNEVIHGLMSTLATVSHKLLTSKKIKIDQLSSKVIQPPRRRNSANPNSTTNSQSSICITPN